MKRKIKVNFVDYWPVDFDFKKGVIYKFLCDNYDVELSEAPDYLFCFPYTRHHLNFKNCIKIFINPENHVGDFNLYDYVVGFDDIVFGDRYVRIPNYTFYPELKSLEKRLQTMPSDEQLLNRGFCSFVVSNAGGDPARGKFFEMLSKYKKVSSGGRYLNNVGSLVSDKGSFCSSFKFNIAFENSVQAGYTTEKLLQPYSYHTVPIYYGNPDVYRDFSADSFVCVREGSEKGLKAAVDQVVALDQDDTAYLRMCKAQGFLHPSDYFEKRLFSFLRNIIDQPFDRAKRISEYGHLREYQIKAVRAAKFEAFFHPRIVSEIVKIRKRI